MNKFFIMSVTGILVSTMLNSCGPATEAEAVLKADTTTVSVGDSLILDGSESVYDTVIEWYQDGTHLDCDGEDFCEITFNTAGTSSINLNVKKKSESDMGSVPLLGGLMGGPKETKASVTLEMTVGGSSSDSNGGSTTVSSADGTSSDSSTSTSSSSSSSSSSSGSTSSSSSTASNKWDSAVWDSSKWGA
ncbi:MAG: hypothetical protein HQM11_18465 [SAR324 cluster bacterium]|nr:hypothetical protein [SAR324 cluster bacterium]